MFSVLTPTPLTVAVIIEPATEPKGGKMSINFGSNSIPSYKISYPLGTPSRK